MSLRVYRSVTLGQYLDQGQKLLLVLIRHFGWLPWRDHVAELEASQVSLQSNGTTYSQFTRLKKLYFGLINKSSLYNTLSPTSSTKWSWPFHVVFPDFPLISTSFLVQCWLFYYQDFFFKVSSLFFVTGSWTKTWERESNRSSGWLVISFHV